MSQYSYDFSKDTRQSKAAIVLLIWKYYKLIFRQFFFLLIPLFVGAKKSTYMILGGVLVVSILVIVMAILAYLKFYFRIENNELIIQKGVFKKTKLSIPFERIQTINFEQNLILQVLQKYKLEVDTAGSSKKEFAFDALDHEIAKQLRQKILDRKREIKEDQASDGEQTRADSHILYDISMEEPEEEIILKHSLSDLLKIGLTENHLRAGAWLIAIVAYLFSTLNEAGVKIEDRIENSGLLKNVDPDLAVILSSIPVVVLVLVMISVVRTFLRYYDLQFNRTETGFKIFSGLLNRKEYSAPDHKIQKVSYGDSPLRRIFGINILTLKQARSTDADMNKSIKIPIIQVENVEETLSFLYEENIDKEQYKFPISIHFFWRHLIYFIIFPALIMVFCAYYFSLIWLYIAAAVFLVYFAISTFVQYKKCAYYFNDYFIKRKKGIYGNHYELAPWYKVQVVEIKQSIYQRRNNIATVFFYTAAGEISIPYIPIDQAIKLRDYALYKAESSSKEWM